MRQLSVIGADARLLLIRALRFLGLSTLSEEEVALYAAALAAERGITEPTGGNDERGTMSDEVTAEGEVPVGTCPHCQRLTPLRLDVMVHEESGKEVGILSCPWCDLVLNLEEDWDDKVEIMTPAEAAEKTGLRLEADDGG